MYSAPSATYCGINKCAKEYRLIKLAGVTFLDSDPSTMVYFEEFLLEALLVSLNVFP